MVVLCQDQCDRYLVIDGYKRVRLLRRLGQDVVRATAWDLSEADALRAHEETRRARDRAQTPAQQMLSDLGSLGGIAGRVYQRIRRGELRGLLPPEREELGHVFSQTRRELVRLLKRLEKELEDARSEHPRSDPATA